MMPKGFIGFKCPKDKIMKNSVTHTFRQAKSELAKVIFPTKPQVKQAFFAVLIVVSVVVLFLAFVDFVMSATVSAILS
jgi:preprotein translocase subunit SecE